MSLSPDKMMLLMALADGELEGDEHAEAETLVATNEEARRVVEALRGPAAEALADWVATSQLELADLAGAAGAAGAESIAGTVMQRIADDAKRGANVSSLDAARRSRVARDARLKVSAFVVAVATLAAGVFFYVGSEHAGPLAPPSAPVASAPTPPAPVTVPMPSPSALANADPSQAPDVPSPGPEVTIESSTSHDVTVFHVPASIGAAVNTPGSVIVWIGDDKPQGK